jgi:hypothetical protein
MSVVGMFRVIFGIFPVIDGWNLYAWYVMVEPETVWVTRNWLTNAMKLFPMADD